MSEDIKKQRDEGFILGALVGCGFGMLFAFTLLTATGWAKELTIGGTTLCIVIAKEDWNTWIGIVVLVGIVLLFMGMLLEVKRRGKLYGKSKIQPTIS